VPERVIEGVSITRCPMSYYGLTESFLVQAYGEYEKGYLPNEGGWLDQPIKFFQAINLIGEIVERLEEQKNGK
jgi:hypothetical protein